MKNNERSLKPVQLLTGKYGILLLTALNVCLAVLVITLSNYWAGLDIIHSNTDFMTFFLPDYRIGFVSRALVGSVIYLFTDHPTVHMVAVILYITIFISGVLFCFMQALLAKKALLTRGYATLLLSYLFFLNKVFWWNSMQEIGMLDIFMTLLVQLFVLCIESRRTPGFLLAPLVCCIGLLIHTAFFFFGFPVAAAILWFELLKSGRPNRTCAAAFTAACILSVALFVLFTIFPHVFVRVTPDELQTLLKEKYSGDIQETYFSSYLFRTNSNEYSEPLEASEFLRYVATRTDFFSPKLRRYLLNLLPLSGLFLFGCVNHMRRSGNRKIAYLGFLAPLVALFPSLYFSSDKERFFSLCIVAQYLLLHYISTQTDIRFLPCAADPPPRVLSASEAKRRKEKIDQVWIACAIAGLIFTIVGAWKL